MYSEIGRPSIAPEKLLRAQLLQMLYSVRREQLLTEGSVPVVRGMNMDESIWDITVFTKNRDRLLEGDVAREFLRPIAE
jgi:transposase